MTENIDRLTVGQAGLIGLCVSLVTLLVAGLLAMPVAPSLVVLGVAAAGWLVAIACTRLFAPLIRRSLGDSLLLTAVAVVAVTGLATLTAALLDVLFAPVVFGALLAAGTIGALLWIGPRLAQPPPGGPVLVVGTGLLADATCFELKARGVPVAGVLTFGEPERESELDSVQPETTECGEPILGRAADLAQVVFDHPVSEVYLAAPVGGHTDEMAGVAQTCARIGVPFAVPLNTLPVRGAKPVVPRSSDGFLHYATAPVKPVQGALKRLVDVAASSAGLLVISPLMVLSALAIKLTSPGPIFFRQERVGLYGARFPMLKFRSMVPDAEERKRELAAENERDGPAFKISHDPRITPVGRFLRKTNIDELPQLINVLRGEMSLVGPRPPVADEVAKYEPWQRRRLAVRPGITCFWQVDDRDHISFEEWMTLDLKYVDSWSLALDFKLLAKTVPVVLTGRGST